MLQESIVGKHVARQLETIYSSAGSEIKARLSPLETKQKSLQAQASTKTSIEEIRADASLRAQAQALQTDKQKLQVEQYYTEQELKITQIKAVGQVSKRVETIIGQIARERNADVVIDKSQVIYGDPADITDLVISRLNSQLTTVPVTRERLPRKG